MHQQFTQKCTPPKNRKRNITNLHDKHSTLISWSPLDKVFLCLISFHHDFWWSIEVRIHPISLLFVLRFCLKGALVFWRWYNIRAHLKSAYSLLRLPCLLLLWVPLSSWQFDAGAVLRLFSFYTGVELQSQKANDRC